MDILVIITILLILLPVCQELLWRKGSPLLPVAGLVHMSAHPSCCHRGHCIPLWVGLFQHLSTRVSHPLLVAGHCAVSLCNACSTDLIHPNVCVVERRFVSLTLSCVPFVTRDAKCGSFLTLAITLRYLPGRDEIGRASCRERV